VDLLGLVERGALGALLIVLLGAVSDRMRPYYGALLASIPTTTAVSLFYIAHDQGTAFAAEAANSSLVTQIGNLVFVVLFSALALWRAPARRWWVPVLAVASYFGIVVPYLVLLHGEPPVLAANLATYAVVLTGALLARRRLRRVPVDERAYGRPALKASHLQRAALGGAFVVLASLLAESLGPHWGGIFASFPATFMSLLLVAYPNRSLPYFLEQALGIVPSTVNLAAFILAVHFAYPALGVWWGTAVAYAVFAAVAVPMAWLNLRSLRKTDAALSGEAILQAATEEPQ
jgi:uncharacterized membrane protein (GlpM family)